MKSLLQINGKISRNIKYGLYAVYLFVFIVAWHSGSGKLLKSFPDIAHAFSVLWFQKGFAQDIFQSMQLNLIAMSVTLILTMVFAYTASFGIARPASFVISKGRFLGLMGLNAIFIELFGLGMGLKVSLLTFSTMVFFLTSMYTIITEIPQEQFDYARALGLSETKVFYHVVVRGTADQSMEAFRQNAAIAWMSLTAVEGIVKSGGIGDILYNSYKHFDRGEVLAIIGTILIIGILQDIGLKYLQKVVNPYV